MRLSHTKVWRIKITNRWAQRLAADAHDFNAAGLTDVISKSNETRALCRYSSRELVIALVLETCSTDPTFCHQTGQGFFATRLQTLTLQSSPCGRTCLLPGRAGVGRVELDSGRARLRRASKTDHTVQRAADDRHPFHRANACLKPRPGPCALAHGVRPSWPLAPRRSPLPRFVSTRPPPARTLLAESLLPIRSD